MALLFLSLPQLTELPEGLSSFLWTTSVVYLAIEVFFYFFFRYHLVPRANQRTTFGKYRDYEEHRHLALLRIVDRIYSTCVKEGGDIQQEAREYLKNFFIEIDEQQQQTSIPTRQDVSKPPASVLPKDLSTPPRLVRVSQSSISATSNGTTDDGDYNSSDDAETYALQGASREEISEAIARLYVPPPKPFKLCQETLDYIADTTLSEGNEPPQWTVDGIHKQDMDDFLGWALFNKYVDELEEWEVAELAKSYIQLERRSGFVFKPGRSETYRAVRMNIEDMDYKHRPLIFYLTFEVLRIIGGIILRLAGFQRVVSESTTVVGWYRPAQTASAEKLLPMLFFHGIAPAGLLFYLPMMLFGIMNDGRAAFMFENPTITFRLSFTAIRDDEMVQGVSEIVDRFLPRHQTLSLCGHSFGSCPMTWLLHAPEFRDRIKQFVLLDPVTILLSESDVIINFLYPKSGLSKVAFAGDDLFVQYYLRRHFHWMNSELWLEACPSSIQVLVGLAEKDEVINSPRVRNHINMFADQSNTKVMHWEGQGHAYCVITPSSWSQIKKTMMEQELLIIQQTREETNNVVGGK